MRLYEFNNNVVIQWESPSINNAELDDNLTADSPWSNNTFFSAENLLYGTAFVDDELVGRIMVGIHNDYLEIDKVWVSEKRQRSGIATKMMQDARRVTGIERIIAPNLTDQGQAWYSSLENRA